MKWNKFRLKTTTEAEDIVSSMLMDLGIQGVQIEDRVPLTKQDQEQMFVDILPQIPEDDGTAYLTFYLEEEEDAGEVLSRVQKELEEKEFTAKSGGGMVSATVNGNREVTKIEIKPEAVDPDDVEMLEDLVRAAVNEALRQYEAASDATGSKITGGMKLGF